MRSDSPTAGHHGPLFPASSVLLQSGDDWRGLDVQRLRLTLETPEHDHAEHFLTLHLGPPAVIESQEGKHHRLVRVTPGDFTLIGAGMPHRVRYEGVDQLAVSLDPGLVANVAAEMADGASAAETPEFAPQHGTRDPQVERLGQLLRAELEAGSTTGPLFADSLARAIAAHLLRRYSSVAETVATRATPADRDGTLSPTRLRRALDYLEANLTRDVSLSELATAAGLSPFHFARQFKAATGMPPHAYLISRRVERAKELLAGTDLPLAAVALAVGFSHQSHLTRHFKNLVGITPARFREAASR